MAQVPIRPRRSSSTPSGDTRLRMEYGVHLPLIELERAPWTLADLSGYARRAAELGYRYLCANDHLLFSRPWLDGPTALAATLGDGWLASGYNTTPARFRESLAQLADPALPNAVGTMWLYVTEKRRDADRIVDQVLAPLLGRPAETIRELALPIGSADQCAERV